MPELLPFQPHADRLSVWGDFQLTEAGIEIRFRIEDPDRLLRGSPRAARWNADELRRADELWRETCFEAFFGVPDSDGYWELNIAADGRWNLYRFDGYRAPQPPTATDDFILEALLTDAGSLAALLRPRDAALLAARPTALPAEFEASLCAVLKTETQTYYYSTKHAGAKADFHLRAGFSLRRKR